MSFSLIGKAVKVLKLPTVDYLNSPTKLIPVQQGDIQSRYFNIILYDDRGNIDLSIYSKAQLFGTVPSGLILTTKCEIAEDKKSVICQFGGGLTAQAGRIPCDIVLTNEDSTVSLTSQTFYAIVYPSQSANIVTENDETYSELLYLINEISTLEKDIHKAEAARAEAENGRVEAELERTAAEALREENEERRNDAEVKRIDAEDGRKGNEESRKQAEFNREEAEGGRASAEALRADAETIRITSEDERIEAEQERIANEESREEAEAARAEAENGRVEAENNRESAFATAKSYCEEATNNANNAAQSVTDLLDALPCPTNKVDGEAVTPIANLQFVALED